MRTESERRWWATRGGVETRTCGRECGIARGLTTDAANGREGGERGEGEESVQRKGGARIETRGL